MILFGPLILLLGPIVIGFGAPFSIFCSGDWPFLVNLILFLLALPLGTALGCLCGALAFTFGTIPFEFVHMTRLFRILFFKLGCNCCMPCCGL